MEKETIPFQSNKNLGVWTVNQISLASYIAGPVGGCYLLSQNFKALNNNNLSKKVLFLGIISTIVLFLALFFVPESIVQRIPRIIIPITYTALISSYAEAYQKRKIHELIKNGTKRYSYLKLILTIFKFLLIQAPLIFLFAYSMSYFF